MTQIPNSLGERTVLAMPGGEGKFPAVVVIHEWWGVNEQIQAVAKKWADAGFIALVPDLYGGKLAANAGEAEAMMKGLDFAKAVREIGDGVEWLRGHDRCTGKVAVTGYCMGGALTLAAAVNVRGLAAAVPYYGLPGDLDWGKVDAPIQAHFATVDDWATVAGAEKIKAAIPSMELHVYEAQHAFCNEKRPEVYNAEACQKAWERTLEFVRTYTT